MIKRQRKIIVVLDNPELEDKLAEKATLKLYELYVAAKLRGDLDKN